MRFSLKWLLIALCAVASPALADSSLVFNQTVIAIVPPNTIPELNKPKGDMVLPQKPANESPSLADSIFSGNGESASVGQPMHERKTLRVITRTDQLSTQQGIITQYRIDEAHGVLTLFPFAEPRYLMPEPIATPVDVLFISEDGVIQQIAPQLNLSMIADDIEVDFPVKALLFMKAGLVESWKIAPGSRVEHSMFHPKPMIIKMD